MSCVRCMRANTHSPRSDVAALQGGKHRTVEGLSKQLLSNGRGFGSWEMCYRTLSASAMETFRVDHCRSYYD